MDSTFDTWQAFASTGESKTTGSNGLHIPSRTTYVYAKK